MFSFAWWASFEEFGALVLGMDISANMLSIAMDRLQNEKDTRVRYQISDALEYEFPANSFDYVFSRDGLHHNERIDIVMRKIFVCFTVAFAVFRYCSHSLASITFLGAFSSSQKVIGML